MNTVKLVSMVEYLVQWCDEGGAPADFDDRFIKEMAEKVENKEKLTTRQMEALENIWEKFRVEQWVEENQ